MCYCLLCKGQENMLLSKRWDGMLHNMFNKYGKFVGKNAVSTILLCILLNGLLGLNIIWMKKTNDIKIFTPYNSRAHEESIEVKQQFPDFSGTNFYEQSLLDTGIYGNLIVKTKNGSNIMNSVYQHDLNNLFNTVRNISISSDGVNYSYEDLCAKRKNKCAFNDFILESNFFWNQVTIQNVTFPVFYDKTGMHILTQTFGGVEMNKDGEVKSVKAFKVSFFLRQDSKFYTELANKWEDKFMQTFKSYKSDCFQIAFSYSNSLASELNANTDVDIRYFSLTFSLMITYASFAAAGGNWISQRGHLARAGVIASGLAILGSFGIGSAMGIEYVSLVGVMPFLIIGIGLDDMFIFLSSHSDVPYEGSPEERVGKTVETCGVAVTITSLTNIVAFSAGAMSSFKSVQIFCFYTGVAVFLCYINQMTFFIGCLAIHERRVAASRHCATCLQTTNADSLKKEGASRLRIICCSGGPPNERNDQETVCQKIPSLLLPNLILQIPVKLIIILFSIGYIGVSIWGILNLKQGLLHQNLVSKTSYYHTYSNWNYKYFPATFIFSIYLPSDLHYSNEMTRQNIQHLITSVCNDNEIDCKNKIDWFSAFASSEWFNDTSEVIFCLNLKSFSTDNPIYANDFVLSDRCDILHSRIHVYSKNVKDTYSQGKLMERLRGKVDQSFRGAFTFSPIYPFFEQYLAVLPNTLQTIGASVAAVFVITCIFMTNPLVILYVTISLIMIMLGLIGFMQIWGLSLSSITMIHVIMSVGFSVDYSTHVCYAYLSSKGETRNARARDAIIRSSGPILNGAVSSLVGIAILSSSESYVFNSFFKVMILVICFGIGQALFFLPVVLSLIGPHETSQTPFTGIIKRTEIEQDNPIFSEKL